MRQDLPHFYGLLGDISWVSPTSINHLEVCNEMVPWDSHHQEGKKSSSKAIPGQSFQFSKPPSRDQQNWHKGNHAFCYYNSFSDFLWPKIGCANFHWLAMPLATHFPFTNSCFSNDHMLVGGLVAIFIFPEILGISNHPNWVIFFRGVASKPPTSHMNHTFLGLLVMFVGYCWIK